MRLGSADSGTGQIPMLDSRLRSLVTSEMVEVDPAELVETVELEPVELDPVELEPVELEPVELEVDPSSQTSVSAAGKAGTAAAGDTSSWWVEVATGTGTVAGMAVDCSSVCSLPAPHSQRQSAGAWAVSPVCLPGTWSSASPSGWTGSHPAGRPPASPQ